MNNDKLLKELSFKVQAGQLSSEEVMRALRIASVPQESEERGLERFTHISVTRMLYIVGAAIAIIGVVLFIHQVWDEIGSFGRIFVTLGLGLLLAGIGSMLFKQKPDNVIGAVFHFLGGALIPGGAVVTLFELSPGISSVWPVAITFGVIFAFYLLLAVIHKHAVLTFFAIGNGTAFIYLVIAAMLKDASYPYKDIYTYLMMIIGASYLFLAHAFSQGWNKYLIGLLSFFGILGFLGAAFSQVFDAVLWEWLYFFIVMGTLLLSVYMKSRIILVMSVIFLLSHLSYITSEYFADSLGWPISLVILGFITIGLGYGSIAINKRYLRT